MQVEIKIEEQIQTLLDNTIIIDRRYLDDEQLQRGEQFKVLKEIFDVDDAVENFMGNREVVLNLFQGLIERIETQLSAAREALESGDFDTLRSEGHSIKGSCLNLSVRNVGNAAAELEAAGRDEDAELGRASLARTETAFQELKAFAAGLL